MKKVTALFLLLVLVFSLVLSGCKKIEYPNDIDKKLYEETVKNLKEGQAFAFASVGGQYDVLLVADETFGIDGDKQGAKEATLYCVESGTHIMDYGKVISKSDNYPIAVFGKYLMFGDSSEISKIYVDVQNGAIMTYENAAVTYDLYGSPSYSYFSLEEHIDGSAPDDSYMKSLQEDYTHAEPLAFTLVE